MGKTGDKIGSVGKQIPANELKLLGIPPASRRFIAGQSNITVREIWVEALFLSLFIPLKVRND